MFFASKKLVGALAVTVAAVVGSIHLTSAQSSTFTLPSSSQSPYIVPVGSNVITGSLLTVGDSVNRGPDGAPYRMVGIPDGLGAFDNGDGTFTVLMNHELPMGAGVVRAHGASGAFVSKWIINKSDFRVINGEDLIRQIATWNPTTSSYNAPTRGVELGRLCSADLPGITAFFNPASRRGYDGRIFMNGEETGAEGRAFGHLLDGTTYELPRLGKFSWENSVANPASGDRTVVMGMDDTTPGQVYVYVGTKSDSGNAIDRAGLTNGNLYGVRVTGVPTENRDTGIPSGTRFDLANFGDVSNTTGAALQTASVAANVTEFLRPEDGAWDPNNPNIFYFVTTDRFDQVKAGTGTQIGRSRLWRLRFDDITNPALGGQIDMLLDGTEPQQMLDNMTVTRNGRILMQEDPGNQAHIAKVWSYNIATNALTLVAQHDPNRFAPGAPNFLTQDEESSGIIDVSEIFGEGFFLLDVQAHYSIPGELVEGGQLLGMYIQP